MNKDRKLKKVSIECQSISSIASGNYDPELIVELQIEKRQLADVVTDALKDPHIQELVVNKSKQDKYSKYRLFKAIFMLNKITKDQEILQSKREKGHVGILISEDAEAERFQTLNKRKQRLLKWARNGCDFNVMTKMVE